ncbi:unnamed protein product [Protopolystoma xenopodis]|uniref:Uncharacterized protein n=1 Tax=Protopolystoma xenopodis TaxID=117903 RepID=A0A448XPK5_9PLAT|nr:unnamed protein product [Protopolystoma xenopodis]
MSIARLIQLSPLEFGRPSVVESVLQSLIDDALFGRCANSAPASIRPAAGIHGQTVGFQSLSTLQMPAPRVNRASGSRGNVLGLAGLAVLLLLVVAGPRRAEARTNLAEFTKVVPREVWQHVEARISDPAFIARPSLLLSLAFLIHAFCMLAVGVMTMHALEGRHSERSLIIEQNTDLLGRLRNID